MTLEQHRLNDNLYFTLSDCPHKYSTPTNSLVNEQFKRMTIYFNERKMMIWDICLTEDTRYEANLEVDPSFRHSEWMDLLTQAEPGSLLAFSRPNAAWINSGSIIIEQEEALVKFHKTMTEKNIMRTERIFAQGSLNKVIPII